jgi:hypothetical protein
MRGKFQPIPGCIYRAHRMRADTICDKNQPLTLKYEENYGDFPGMSAARPRELRIPRICVCVTHIQLDSGAVSGEPLQIET